MVETAYLTWQKLASAPTLCGVSTCTSVLSGPYSSVAGVPLAALGLGAYTIVCALALAPRLDAALDLRTRAPLAAVRRHVPCRLIYDD